MNTKIYLLLGAVVVFGIYGSLVQAATPAVNAGPDQYINSGQTVTLQASASDPSGSSIAYSWFCTSGTVSNPTIAQPVYTPLSFGNPTSATCTLTVTNQQGVTNYDSVTIFINSGQQTGTFWVQTNVTTTAVTGTMTVTKQVRNLSSGQLVFASSVGATMNDIVQFMITIQAPNNQMLHNVTVRDYSPSNVTYYNNLTVDGVTNSGNIMSWPILLGDMQAGQIKTLLYQAQVSSNLPYGTSTITNSVNVTSVEASGTASASIIASRSTVLGATDVSTGLTNNPLVDSFFLPLVLLMGVVVGYSVFKKLRKS